MHQNAVDLHTHTTVSDGALTPHELIERAHAYGLRALSITDHDTVAAYSKEILNQAAALGIELVPGIEFSTRDEEGNKYHILGLLIDPENESLRRLTASLKQRRTEETVAMCTLLEEHGWYVNQDELLGESDVVTKAHIARAVLREERNKESLIAAFGHSPTEGEFIEATLIKGKPAFVKGSENLTPQEAIHAVHDAGGVAILAHPSFYVMKGEPLEALCEKFIAWRIDGFEAINVQYDKSGGDQEVEHIEEFTNIAQKHGLVISGGSDFHTDDEATMGKYIDLGFKGDERFVPYAVLEELREFQKNKKS